MLRAELERVLERALPDALFEELRVERLLADRALLDCVLRDCVPRAFVVERERDCDFACDRELRPVPFPLRDRSDVRLEEELRASSKSTMRACLAMNSPL